MHHHRVGLQKSEDFLPVLRIKPHVAPDVIGGLGRFGVADRHPLSDGAAPFEQPAFPGRFDKRAPFLQGRLAFRVVVDKEDVLGHGAGGFRDLPLFLYDFIVNF